MQADRERAARIESNRNVWWEVATMEAKRDLWAVSFTPPGKINLKP